MENLNDVEFGSDKSNEEAPILVAQRYLNIYRQVHIFNKTKRDQFDDELLALPPTITDFFKRMPGGRLLVEHIEEVKTERGISFIKSNKEDFAEGSGTGASPAPVQVAGGAPVVAGSLAIDASFADALAQSMAAAFKQNPMQATVSGGSVAGGTIDFGNTFDVIAEEIKTSRTSLLDVLKETRNITDSVIASQVSISRILEGILSARNRDDIGKADLNNRIIASQASITKLLEGMYTSNAQKNSEISDFLNIENKLQSFKNEIRAEMESSLNKMQTMLLEYVKNIASINQTSASMANSQQMQNVRFEEKKDNQYTPRAEAVSSDYTLQQNQNSSYSGEQADAFVSQDEIVRKKKKKKKNRLDNINNFADNRETAVNTNPNYNQQQIRTNENTFNRTSFEQQKDASNHNEAIERQNTSTNSFVNKEFNENRQAGNQASQQTVKTQTAGTQRNVKSEVLASVSPVAAIQAVGGIIKNHIHKYENNFNNVKPDAPINNANIVDDNYLHTDDESFADDMDFVLPEYSKPEAEQNIINNERFEDISHDDLSYDLPKQGASLRGDEVQSDFNEFTDDLSNISDDLNYVLPPQGSAIEQTNDVAVDFDTNNFDDDGLAFGLPLQNNNADEDISFTDFGENMETNPIYNEEQNIALSDDSFNNFATTSQDEYTVSNNEEIINFEENTPLADNSFTYDNETQNNTFAEFEQNDFSALNTQQFDTPQSNDFGMNSNTFTDDGLDDFLNGNMTDNLDNFSGFENVEAQSVQTDIEENNNFETNFVQENEQTFDTFNTEPQNESTTTSFDNGFAPTTEDAGLDNLDSFLSSNDGENELNSNANFDNEIIAGSDNYNEVLSNEDSTSAGLEDFLAPEPTIVATTSENSTPQTQSRYKAELDKIREALTADNIDISSLDTPIALDEYSDDENVQLDDLSPNSYENSQTSVNSSFNNPSNEASDEEEYEWVDENGNPIEGGDDEEWEWVDENGNLINGDDDGEYEYEYVEEDEDTSSNNT